MFRSSIATLAFSWIVATSSLGWSQSATTEISTGTCDSGECDNGNGSSVGTWWQHKQAECDLIKQHADLIAQRNDAWPKPFLCHDRQAYHAIFAVMTQRGWQCECTLTSDHFDPQTQQLNRAGKAKISGIMTNLPEVARQVHVLQDSTNEVAEARMENVRNEIQNKFVALPIPEIAVTNYAPHGMNGALVEDVQKRFVEGLPAPAVPAAKTTTISNQ